MKRGRRQGSILAAGLTPLIDTLFLLLFVVLSMIGVEQEEEAQEEPREEVRVELPAVEQGGAPAAEPPRTLTLELSADGALTVGDPGVTLRTREELDAALARELGRDAAGTETLPEEVAIELRIDRGTPHGTAADLLQHLRLRGFLRVQLVAQGVGGATGAFGEAPR